MRFVIAPDKFRGSLTAVEAAQAIARGVLRADPAGSLVLVPLADGGEGLADAIVGNLEGTWHEAVVSGPLGDRTLARFCLLHANQTAVLEMAAASGLSLLARERYDPMRTSTRGTGELMLAALQTGADRLLVGIGGSATNDGGAGMAQALGYRLLDRTGHEIGPGGGSLDQLDRIDATSVHPRLKQVAIVAAADVSNPLCGPSGASRIYGPQKGATREQVNQLDSNLAHLARIIERDLGVAIRDRPGGGAAGGLGAGLIAFTGATLRPGIDLVLETVGMYEQLQQADLCITGEGCLDGTTTAGKTVAGVAQLAYSLGVPTFVLAGTLGPGAEQTLSNGVAAYFSICPGPVSLAEALSQAGDWLAHTAEQVTRVWLAGLAGPKVNPLPTTREPVSCQSPSGESRHTHG